MRRATSARYVTALLVVTLGLSLAGCRGPDGAGGSTSGGSTSSGPTGSADVERELGELESTVRRIEEELARDGA